MDKHTPETKKHLSMYKWRTLICTTPVAMASSMPIHETTTIHHSIWKFPPRNVYVGHSMYGHANCHGPWVNAYHSLSPVDWQRNLCARTHHLQHWPCQVCCDVPSSDNKQHRCCCVHDSQIATHPSPSAPPTCLLVIIRRPIAVWEDERFKNQICKDIM